MNHMDETVVHEPKDQSGSGPEDPMGSSDMPKANHSLQQAQGRYTFGSGPARWMAIRSSEPSAAGASARSTMPRPIPARKSRSS